MHWLGREEIDEGTRVLVRLEAPGRASFVLEHEGHPPALRHFDHAPRECETLRAAMGLSLALALDAGVTERLGETGGRPAAVSVPVAGPVSVPVAGPASVPVAGPVYVPGGPVSGLAPVAVAALPDLRLLISPNLVFGAGPSSLFAFDAMLRVAFEDGELEAGLIASAEDDISLGRGRVRGSFLGVELGACAKTRMGAVDLLPCAGLWISSARARGEGFSEDHEAHLLWTAATAGARVRLRLSRLLSFVASADVLVSLARPSFDVFDSANNAMISTSYDTLGARLGLGLELSPWNPSSD